MLNVPTDEYVVFITPTQLQLSIFEKMLSSDKLDNLVRNSTAESLALINMLTKISNSPILLKATADQARLKAQQTGDTVKRNAIEEALKLLPERAQVDDLSLSGKHTWYFVEPNNLHSTFARQTERPRYLASSTSQGKFKQFARRTHVLTHSCTAYRREMYHRVTLHFHAQHHRGILQEEVLHI